MRNYNTAPEFDFDENDESVNNRVAQGTRPNVPPPTYKVMGEDRNALPIPAPMPPLPQTTAPRPRPTASVPVPTRRPTASLPVPVPRPQRAMRPRARSGILESGWLSAGKIRLAFMGLGLIVAGLILYTLVSAGLHAWQTWQDDLTYGRPRTMQVDQFVGHNEQDGIPSHFIAQNNNRQITVVEYPGGDVSKTRVFQGPRLFGKDTELLPVKIHFEDVNGDNNVDMLLEVDNQLIIYINQDSNFRPITGEERARLKLK